MSDLEREVADLRAKVELLSGQLAALQALYDMLLARVIAAEHR